MLHSISHALVGVVFMAPLMNRKALFCTLSNVARFVCVAVPMYSCRSVFLFAPHLGLASFLTIFNRRLAFPAVFSMCFLIAIYAYNMHTLVKLLTLDTPTTRVNTSFVSISYAQYGHYHVLLLSSLVKNKIKCCIRCRYIYEKNALRIVPKGWTVIRTDDKSNQRPHCRVKKHDLLPQIPEMYQLLQSSFFAHPVDLKAGLLWVYILWFNRWTCVSPLCRVTGELHGGTS